MYKKIILYCSILSPLSAYSFSLQEWWNSLWDGNKEVVTKEYDINPLAAITLNLYGNVIIKPFKQKKLFIEMQGSCDALESTKINTKITHNSALITATSKNENDVMLDYTILVPTDANVTLITQKGFIELHGIEGILHATTHNGNIEIINGISTITAKSPHGYIKAQQKKLLPQASLFLEAGKNITLALSRNTNAHLHAKTTHGSIESELNITLDPVKTLLNKDCWKKLMHDVKGILGTGGAPITLDVTKGNITIEEL